MSLPVSIAYSMNAQARRHAPSGYKDYRQYKPWLRDEFTFRCVYCLERETWYPNGSDSFSVDHIVPQSADQNRICDYENLLYACMRCNSARQDLMVLDPTTTPFGTHLRVEENGRIRGLTPDGLDLVDLLHLNSDSAIRVREKHLRILSLRKKYPEDPDVYQLFLQAFRYPADLPDLLRLRPPG